MPDISGTVEDETGTAIENVDVIAVKHSDATVAGTATTDSNGAYTITDLDEGAEYHVAVRPASSDDELNASSKPFIEPFTADGPIDDFEDADIAEYTGDTDDFRVQSDRAYEGSYALELTNDDGATYQLVSTSGLPRYPTSGDTFSCRVWFEGLDAVGAFLFGVQDSDTYYGAELRMKEGLDPHEVVLRRSSSDGSTTLASEAAALDTDTWLEVVVEWHPDDGDDIVVTVNDADGELASITGTDDALDAGGVGWQALTDRYQGESVYVDLAQLDTAGEDPIPSNVIDDFEGGDLNKYTVKPSGTFSATQTDTIEGDWSVQCEGESGDENENAFMSEPGDGLSVYPDKGDTIGMLIKSQSQPNRVGLLHNGNIRGNGNFDFYAVEIHTSNNEIIIFKYVDAPLGTSTGREILNTEPVTIAGDTVYWVESDIPDSNGNLEGRVYQVDAISPQSVDRGDLLQTISATDTLHVGNRGIGGVVGDVGTETVFDLMGTV